MSKQLKAVYVTEVKVKDPDSETRVTVGIYKDPESKGLFGVEELFFDHIGEQVRLTYNEDTMLICGESLFQ
jgi:hypothetical protein